MSRKAQQVIKEKGIKRGGDNWSKQTRNEKGMCKDQTAAKIKAVADMMGGAPTQAEFLRQFGQGQADVVSHWWGSWREALRELGYTHTSEKRLATRENRQLRAIKAMNVFYETEGRTPQWSDFNSVDYLPGGKLTQRLFGTLNEARHAAGVPVLVRHGRSWHEEVTT
jgi:hypothetical protein